MFLPYNVRVLRLIAIVKCIAAFQFLLADKFNRRNMFWKAVQAFLNRPAEVWVYSWKATGNQYREGNAEWGENNHRINTKVNKPHNIRLTKQSFMNLYHLRIHNNVHILQI